VFFLILFRNMFWWVGTPNLGVCVSSKSLKWGRWSAVYAVETSAFNQFPALFSRYLQASFFLRTWTVTKCNLVKVVILWWFVSDREHLNSLWHVFFQRETSNQCVLVVFLQSVPMCRWCLRTSQHLNAT
jgi:hypothetical protein